MRSLTTGLLCALWSLPAPAFAQETDSAAAEALFQEGRALMAQGELETACPKLAASHRIDPATGTLIALAACHERQGRLASAWAEFTEAAGRAARERRDDRRQFASERAAALEPRLSTLTIRVAPEVASLRGVRIERSKVVLERGAWNVPVPIDGGSHAIGVSAPGHEAWSTQVSVAPEGDRVTVEIDGKALVPRTTEGSKLGVGTGQVASASRDQGWSRLRWLGVGYAATGAVSLGVSGFVLLRALDKRSDAEEQGCRGGACPDAPAQADSEDAQRLGNWATGFAVAGGALLATGAVLFWVGRPEAAESGAAVALAGDASGPRLSISGRF